MPASPVLLGGTNSTVLATARSRQGPAVLRRNVQRDIQRLAAPAETALLGWPALPRVAPQRRTPRTERDVGSESTSAQAERAAPATMPAATPDADIHLERVTKRFGETVAVDDLTLSIERGSFYAMLGPSGCGKTTTLRMIGGFEDPSEGVVYLGGQAVTDLPPYKRDVNTVFQSYALFPHLNVEKNVGFGLERKKT